MKDSLFYFGDKTLRRDRAHIMGILNVTPDSFSDGGRYNQLDRALLQAEQMIASGAAIIDVGGESTRPGAEPVTLQQEQDRVLPVVEAIRSRLDTIVSVDTSSPSLMRDAAALGARMINDVRALTRDGALSAAADVDLPVCLMHMRGEPKTMQQSPPEYADVLQEVGQFLSERVTACESAGIDRKNILLDPGFGFGKTPEHNLTLLNRLDELRIGGFPLLVGLSRKSLIAHVLGRPVGERLHGSLALAATAAIRGAWIIRVHDVAESSDVVKIINAVKAESLLESEG